MDKTVLALLIVSGAVNGWLWKRVADQERQLHSQEITSAQAKELRRKVQELESNALAAAKSVSSSAEISELARLRNEVGKLRQQLKGAQKPASATISWRRVPATADWSEKFAAATNELALREQHLEELSSHHEKLISSLADASAEQLDDLRRRAQSRQCMSNLKRIGLAARIWANDHDDKFPPDYVTMREELGTPKLLFCPASPGGPVTDWSQLNPAAVTYTWHGSTADEQKPESALTACPIHGHVGLADGSAQMTRSAGYLE